MPKEPEELAPDSVRRPISRPAGQAVRESPFCIHLRSKKAFFLRAPAVEEGDLLDGSGHCWCRRTMQVFGPDGDPALPAECKAGRTCFESIL